MYLDDLFNQAAKKVAPRTDVSVDAALTGNREGDPVLPSSFAFAALGTLKYTPRATRERKGFLGTSPAFFKGDVEFPGHKIGLKITAPSSLTQPNAVYRVDITEGHDHVSFDAQIDGQTNVLFGSSNSMFFSISLCHLNAIELG